MSGAATVTSARASITDRVVNTCVGQPRVSIWAMIANPSGSSVGAMYAQYGYLKYGTQTTAKYFYEFNDGTCFGIGGVPTPQCSDPTHFKLVQGANINPGTTHEYQVVLVCYNPDNVCAFDLYRDGSRNGSTPWDPRIAWGSAIGWDAQFFAETHNYEDDVPGTPSYPAIISDPRIQLAAGGSWQKPDHNTTADDFPAAYRYSENNFDDFEVWTSRDYCVPPTCPT